MGCGHDDAFARLECVSHVVDRDNPLALKCRDKRVARGGVRADALALREGKERDAKPLVLNERLADDLSLGVCDLLLEQEWLLMLDIVQDCHDVSSLCVLRISVSIIHGISPKECDQNHNSEKNIRNLKNQIFGSMINVVETHYVSCNIYFLCEKR